MVGIPGRSKACSTCKRRKVRCDETKPSCKRCTSSYMTCEGYTRTTIFVDQAGKREYVETPSSSHSRSTLSAPRSHNSGASDDSQKARTPSVSPGALALSGLQMDACVAYMTRRLFPTNNGDATSVTTGRSWLLDAIDLDKTLVIYHAACALSLAIYARMQDHSLQIKQAYAVSYGKALLHLNNNLKDARRCRDPSNIAASFLLGIYELCVYNNSNGWLQHAGGIEKLIRLRGAASHRQGLAQRFFVSSRLQIVGRAMDARKRTFLEEPEWRDTCFYGQPKEPVHQLIDILAAVPGLREDSDCLMGKRSTGDENFERMFQDFRIRLVRLLSDFFLWRWRWEREHPFAAFEVPVRPGDGISTDDLGVPLFDTILYYSDLHQGARAVMCYNAGLLSLLELAKSWNIDNLPGLALSSMSTIDDLGEPSCTNPLVMPHMTLSPVEIGNEMCRSMEFHLQGERNSVGALHLMLPIRTLLRFGQPPRTMRWLVSLTSKISNTCGFGFSERLTDLRAMAADRSARLSV